MSRQANRREPSGSSPHASTSESLLQLQVEAVMELTAAGVGHRFSLQPELRGSELLADTVSRALIAD